MYGKGKKISDCASCSATVVIDKYTFIQTEEEIRRDEIIVEFWLMVKSYSEFKDSRYGSSYL